MKTKRELIASAIILIGSGSILSAAALATSPSQELNTARKASPGEATSKEISAAAAQIGAEAAASLLVATEPVEVVQNTPPVQVVTGDLENNELFIFADNASIPEKILDEHPDAEMVVLGANETVATEKIERFKKTAQVVAQKKEKAKALADKQAEVDYQTLATWNGTEMSLSFDRKIVNAAASALPIQQHLYPITMQLIERSAITLSDADKALLQQDRQHQSEVSDQAADLPVLSMADLDKMAHHDKIMLPKYRGFHHRPMQVAQYLSGHVEGRRASEHSVNAKAHRANAPIKANRVTALFGKHTVVEAFALAMKHHLLGYAARFAEHINVRIPAVTVKTRALASTASSKEMVKPSHAPHHMMAGMNATLKLPAGGLHHYAFRLPSYLNMAVSKQAMQMAMASAAPAAPAATLATVANTNTATTTEMGVFGTAVNHAHLANKDAHESLTQPLLSQLHPHSHQVGAALKIDSLASHDHAFVMKAAVSPSTAKKVDEFAHAEVSHQQVTASQEKVMAAIAAAVTMKNHSVDESRTPDVKLADVEKSGSTKSVANVAEVKVAASEQPTHADNHQSVVGAIAALKEQTLSVHHQAIKASIHRAVASTKKNVTEDQSDRPHKMSVTKLAVATKSKPLTKMRGIAPSSQPKAASPKKTAMHAQALNHIERQLEEEPLPYQRKREVKTRIVRSQPAEAAMRASSHVFKQASAPVERPIKRQHHSRPSRESYNVASMDESTVYQKKRSQLEATKRARRWRDPAGFSKMMME